MARHIESRNNLPPLSPAMRLRRTGNVLRIATPIVVVAAAAITAAGWASRSMLLFLAGLIGGCIALGASGLLRHVEDVAMNRAGISDTGPGLAAAAPAPVAAAGPVAAAAPAPAAAPAAVPDPAAQILGASAQTAATVPSPAGPANPAVQRKNFVRHPRPLNSHHGAYVLEQSGTSRLFVLAGAVIGARHDQAGVVREDDVAFAVDPAATGAVIAAVADGLGSARLSHVASALAARSAVELLSSAWLRGPDDHGIVGARPWHLLANQLVANLTDLLAEEHVAARANDLGLAPAGQESRSRQRRPSTTLAVIAVDHTAGGLCASWYTVGDCEVAIADTVTGDVTWLTPVGERDDQVTAAVPPAREASHGGQHLIADGQAVLAMTDGMAKLVHFHPEHMLRALATAQGQGSALGDLLAALDSYQQGNFDDRSAIAVGPLRQDRR
jgi:Protein phosphatase 2C